MNPIERFNDWYQEETQKSSVRIPSACCLTSIGLDGYPNSRFVSLKEVRDNRFIITGPLNSKKGEELINNPKASLTFWWTETERQVRIQGDAIQIEEQFAEKYFSERDKESKIVSSICHQGEEIKNLDNLLSLFEQKKMEFSHSDPQKPALWSGFCILPNRIELMQFKNSRFHDRDLYTKENNSWGKIKVQP